MTQTTESRKIAALLAMLDQREATARAAYDEIRDRINDDERTARDGNVPAMSEEEMRAARIARLSASARWTEAQEAQAVAQRIASS